MVRDLSHAGLDWISQNNYVTSIGGWKPSNNQIFDTATNGVNSVYPYGTANWDWDIAEIVVFNKKLSNNNNFRTFKKPQQIFKNIKQY